MPDAIMTLQYEGEAVDAGTMDVRSLAPALLAAADAVRVAHQLLRVSGPAPQVEVRATRPGSFVIDLLVAEPNLIQRAMEILNSSPVTAALDLSGVVGIVVGSFGLVKKLRNRKITSTEKIRPDLIRLILEDGTVIETPPESFQLVLDADYRRAVRGMVEPLTGNRGVTALTASTEDQTEAMTRADVSAFDVPPAIEVALLDTTSEAVLRPIAVSFSEGNKWRFSDGDATFFAAIEDARFAHAVEVGSERFAKNDLLRVRLRTRQSKIQGGLRTERTIVEVIDHIPGSTQLNLFADIPAGDDDLSYPAMPNDDGSPDPRLGDGP
jgi:hypothetical protein